MFYTSINRIDKPKKKKKREEKLARCLKVVVIRQDGVWTNSQEVDSEFES